MFADDGAEAVIGVGGGLVRTADGEGAVRFGVAPEPGVAGAVAPCPMPWFGVAWPGEDLAIPGLIVLFLVVALVLVRIVRGGRSEVST